MATVSIRTVTMSIEERNLLVTQDGNWGQGVTVRIWEKGAMRRVYVSVGKDKLYMDLNDDSDLEMLFHNAETAQAVAAFINALVEAQAPVIEEVSEENLVIERELTNTEDSLLLCPSQFPPTQTIQIGWELGQGAKLTVGNEIAIVNFEQDYPTIRLSKSAMKAWEAYVSAFEADRKATEWVYAGR